MSIIGTAAVLAGLMLLAVIIFYPKFDKDASPCILDKNEKCRKCGQCGIR